MSITKKREKLREEKNMNFNRNNLHILSYAFRSVNFILKFFYRHFSSPSLYFPPFLSSMLYVATVGAEANEINKKNSRDKQRISN